jgi:hypothetical protein
MKENKKYAQHKVIKPRSFKISPFFNIHRKAYSLATS